MQRDRNIYKKRNPGLHTIEEIVCANTGASAEEMVHDTAPYTVDGIREAVQLIHWGMQQKKRFYIAADYDVDGIAAASILDMALRELDCAVVVRLPKRFSEGYGLSMKAVDEFEDGQFVITVDNGITSIDAIHRAKEKGMTVIITDHHLAKVDEENEEPIYPDADLIIDPNAIPFSADFEGYCGAGLAYKLALSLLGPEHRLLPKLTSFAAIATIADSVPLIKENRRIVKAGLKSMVTKGGSTMGLYALLYTLDLDRYVNSVNIAFKLAPVLNAPGRLRDDGAMDSFRLLTFDGPYYRAKALTEKLLEDNKTRRQLTEYWMQKTMEYITKECMFGNFPVVAYIPGTPEGIIGIIAGRMAELMKAPCFILTDSEPGVLKGSGRSFGGVNLKKLLDANRNYLIKYGGHADAAGISIKSEVYMEFSNALMDTLNGYQVPVSDEIQYDLKIAAKELPEIMREIIKFEPYGMKNPAPVIYIEDLLLTPSGTSHYKLFSNGKGVRLQCAELDIVAFDGASEYARLKTPRHVDLIGTLSLHYFMGQCRNQMEVSHICSRDKDEEKTPLASELESLAMGRYANP